MGWAVKIMAMQAVGGAVMLNLVHRFGWVTAFVVFALTYCYLFGKYAKT